MREERTPRVRSSNFIRLIRLIGFIRFIRIIIDTFWQPSHSTTHNEILLLILIRFNFSI